MAAAPAVARLVLIRAAAPIIWISMALLRRVVILRRGATRIWLGSCTTVGREITLLVSPVFLLKVAFDVPRIVLVEDLGRQLL